MVRVERLFQTCLVVALVLGAAGCAGTAGSVTPVRVVASPAELARYRSVDVQVTRADGVEAGAGDTERIGRGIAAAVREKAPGRFPAREAPGIQATVHLTRYEKGSAFARFMLAGLGQMHIEGDVTLKDQESGALLAQYQVSKTFAWGGMYGGSTTIEDVEVGFAGAAAEAILAPGQGKG